MSSPMTAEEYSDSVRAWLAQAYQWQALAYCKSNFFPFIILRVLTSELIAQMSID